MRDGRNDCTVVSNKKSIMSGTAGTLYVVATPIGNLDDIGQRAQQVLNNVARIAAEDTRHSGILLHKLGIDRPLVSCHEHNEDQRLDSLLACLHQGQDIALIADAGTPLICDPGYLLVNACHRAGIRVVPIPGPCALITALSASGFPADRFVFEGFLPARSTARRKRMQALLQETRTMVFYEAVHRATDFLADACMVFGDERPALIARELTKLHEQLIHGTLAGLAVQLGKKPLPAKGEFVILLRGQQAIPTSEEEVLRVLGILLDQLSLRDAVSLASRISGCARNRVYRLAQKHFAGR